MHRVSHLRLATTTVIVNEPRSRTPASTPKFHPKYVGAPSRGRAHTRLMGQSHRSVKTETMVNPRTLHAMRCGWKRCDRIPKSSGSRHTMRQVMIARVRYRAVDQMQAYNNTCSREKLSARIQRSLGERCHQAFESRECLRMWLVWG